MGTYALENWFDYEMNGKMPLSLLESQFNEEYDNFMKMMNAIDICNESGIVVLEISGAKIKEKIISILEKFRDWVRGILKILKGKETELKEKEIRVAESNLDEIRKMEHAEEKEEEDKKSIDVDIKISRIKINGKIKDHIDLLTNADDLAISAKADAIKDTDVDGGYWKGASPDKIVIEKVDDIVVKKAPMSEQEYANIVERQIHDLEKANSSMISSVKYSEEEINRLIDKINKTSEEIMMVANPNSDDSNAMVEERKDKINDYKREILDIKYDIAIDKELSKFIYAELGRIRRDTSRILH